jgi:hypothetical protein
MKKVYGMCLAALLALVVQGCGALPGFPGARSAEEPTATAEQAAVAPMVDIQATVAAQVQATVQAQQAAAEPTALPTSAPVAGAERTVAPEKTTEPRATTAPRATTEPADAEATAELDTAATAEPAADAASKPEANSGPGRLIALSQSGRASMLTENGWSQPQISGTFSGDYCTPEGSEIGFDASGAIWVSCSGSIRTSNDGAAWTEFDERFVGDIVFDPQGRLWSYWASEVEMIDNGEVKTFAPADATGEQGFPSGSMTFASDGTTWIGGFNSDGSKLVSFDGNAWKTYDNIGLPSDGHPNSLLWTSKGELLAGANGGVYKLTGDSFTELISDQLFAEQLESSFFGEDFTKMAEGPDGTVWMASDSGLFSWDGSQVTVHDVVSGLPSNDIRDIAFDTQGNVWVATGYGVATRVGDAWKVALPATSGINDSDIVAIAVQGAPTMPDAAATPKTATITGRVVESNEPLVNSEVELCSERPSNNNRNLGDTPCAGVGYSQVVTTDDQGMYRIENVPLGTYELASVRRRDGQWVVFIGGSKILALEEGKEVTHDVQFD